MCSFFSPTEGLSKSTSRTLWLPDGDSVFVEGVTCSVRASCPGANGTGCPLAIASAVPFAMNRMQTYSATSSLIEETVWLFWGG